MTRSLRDWTKAFFRDEVFSPGQPEALAAAPAEARFVARALDLERGASVLDVCCGTGRHAFELARKGARVVGVDATERYLAQARHKARGAANPLFLRGDMRRLPFEGEFDAAVNLWTSFGYFVDYADDVRALRAIARSLKPGGRFLLDVINGDWVREQGLRKNWRRRGDGAYVLEDLEVREGRDPAHINTWTILKKGEPTRRATFFVRSYNKARLSKTLRSAGLVPRRFWGGLDGAPFRPLSQRLVCLALRP